MHRLVVPDFTEAGAGAALKAFLPWASRQSWPSKVAESRRRNRSVIQLSRDNTGKNSYNEMQLPVSAPAYVLLATVQVRRDLLPNGPSASSMRCVLRRTVIFHVVGPVND